MNSHVYEITETTDNMCTWFDQHKVYLTWFKQCKGLLWIKGKPGAGKSTLMRHALELAKSGNGRFISFFFYGRGTDLQKTPIGLFRSLLHQLLQQEPNSLSLLTSIFQKRCRTEGAHGKKWTWQTGELRGLFKTCVKDAAKSQPLRVYVDALDEAGEETARELVACFTQLVTEASRSGLLSVCFSCRHYPLVAFPNAGKDGLIIRVEDENRGDIAAYVRYKLHDRISDNKQLKVLKETIVDKASGVFQWVVLVIQAIARLLDQGKNMKSAEKKLEELPTALDNLYADLLNQLSTEDRPQSLKLMRWVCFAERPLSMQELRYAMMFDEETTYDTLEDYQDSEAYIETDEQMMKRVVNLSGGLRETTQISSRRQRHTPYRHMAQFIHQSVKDYFMAKGLASLGDSPAANVLGQAHFQLSRACIRFMILQDVCRFCLPAGSRGLALRVDMTSEPSFLQYALEYWIKHATVVEAHQIAQTDLLRLFAWPSSWILRELISTYEIYFPAPELGFPSKGVTLLHIASQYGFPSIILPALSMDLGVDANATDVKGLTPIHYAVRFGHVAVVKALLSQARVDVNIADNRGLTPLHHAIKDEGDASRTTEVLRLLLQRDDIKVNLRNRDGETPLMRAVTKRSESAIKQLLDREDVDANATKHGKISPLSWAARQGWDTTAQQLLTRHDINVNNKDARGRTALMEAAVSGNEAVMLMLLKRKDIDVDGKDVEGATALTLVIFQDSWLTDTDVNEEVQSEELVRMLLDRGANVNHVNGNGETPLSLAVAWRRCEMVQLLLERRAQIAGRSTRGQALLSHAIIRHSRQHVELLLQWGAELEAKNSRFSETPLSLAARMPDGKEFVELLLQSRPNIEARDAWDQTPLALAAKEGHEEAVELLLRAGANIHTQNLRKDTPLALAAEHGRNSTVRLLLQHGAELNEKNRDGKTPLALAAQNGHSSAAMLLLTKGAKVNATDENGRTPLALAVLNEAGGEMTRLLEHWDGELKPASEFAWSSRESSWDPMIEAAREAAREAAELRNPRRWSDAEIVEERLLDIALEDEENDMDYENYMLWCQEQIEEYERSWDTALGDRMDDIDYESYMLWCQEQIEGDEGDGNDRCG